MDEHKLIEIEGIITNGEYKGKSFGFVIEATPDNKAKSQCTSATIDGVEILSSRLIVEMNAGEAATFKLDGYLDSKDGHPYVV